MPNQIHSRETKLFNLSKTKHSLGLAPEEIHTVDRLLVRKWNVDFLKTGLSLEDYLSQLPASDARDRGLEAFERARNTKDSSCGELLMYEAMADLDLCGVVTSSRRQYIIDAISLSCSLYRTLSLSGAILDVGCHAGIVPDMVARTLGVPVIGIDPVSEAIESGKRALENCQNVVLKCAASPWETNARFDLITAIDCIPVGVGDRGMFLKGIGSLLNDGGVAIVTSANWIYADVTPLRRQLSLAKLGFGFADVVGGYGGMPTEFTAEGTVCFLKGGTRKFPRNVKAEMESEWDLFRDYANDRDTPEREKSQAFFRARYHSQLERKASAVLAD